MALSRVLIALITLTLPLCALSVTTSRYPTRYTTPRYQSSTSINHRHRHTYYYYMDSSSYCSLASTTQQFWNDDDDAYVNAWSTPKYVKGPTGSCSYTFSDYGVDGLKFKFTRLDITDCSVKVNVYRQSFAYGTPDVSMTK